MGISYCLFHGLSLNRVVVKSFPVTYQAKRCERKIVHCLFKWAREHQKINKCIKQCKTTLVLPSFISFFKLTAISPHKYPSLYMTYLFINICTYMYQMAPVVGLFVPSAYESPCTQQHPRKLKSIICSNHFTRIFHDTQLSVRV